MNADQNWASEIGRQASALPPQAASLTAAARQLAASVGGDVAVEVHGEQMIANARLPAADWTPVSGRVLVADENALVRDVVCRMVRVMGLAVDAAGSLDELMARLGAVGDTQGLLILIDGNLADRTHGVAVAWLVQHRPDLADRLVVLTALPTAPQTRQALEALDREWYLGKPFKVETLAALVRRRLMCLEA